MTSAPRESASAVERARALLSRMTFAEKAAQMVQISLSRVSWEEAEMWARERGVGSFLHAVGNEVCRLQGFARASRLGIPLLMGIDAIHGHALRNGATVFPVPLALACAFSPELARRVAAATAGEVSRDGLHWVFSPLLCQARDLRWGRVGETFGEDRFLIGELGAAMVRGYQGERLSDPESVLACVKHYIAYGESTGGRDAYDASVSFRRVLETFWPPFERALSAGAASVMTAYHPVDGVPCGANRRLLNALLRQKAGFDGILVTDWSNMESLVSRQHVAENLRDAALLTLATTHDVIMNTPEFYDVALSLRAEGLLAEDALDASVLRILQTKIALGLLDGEEKLPRAARELPQKMLDEHRALALEAAAASMTLLQNKGDVLPLSGVRTLALIGPAADSVRAQFGDWTFFTHPDPDETRKPVGQVSTFREGLAAACRVRGVTLLTEKGCDFMGQWENLQAAVSAASKADVAIVCLGDCLRQTGEGHDRADLALSGAQNALIEAVAKTGTPVIGVFTASKPLVLDRMAKASAALVCAFNPGERAGEALAALLFGERNFEGRLPVSFPRATGQLPVYYNQLPGWHGERYVDAEAGPLFAFGEGLAYTSFRYESLRVSAVEGGVLAEATVVNTGARAGVETVQFYVRDLVSSVMQPVLQLAGFQKLALAPGQAARATCLLGWEAFSLVNEEERRVVEAGAFAVYAGPSSRMEGLLRAELVLDANHLETAGAFRKRPTA